MSLKKRILLILSATTILSTILSSALLVCLLQKISRLSGEGIHVSILIVCAVVIYLLCGLFFLILLNSFLGKSVVIPAVEREMLESERTVLSEQLHHSRKMESVGRMAGSIAHDFNNLLTIIDGYTSMIIADPKAEETARHAEEVLTAARKASAITRKLLTLNQKEKSESVILDLNDVLQDSDKMLRRLLGEKITLVTKQLEKPIYVKADPLQIEQVIMNLAVNARDAMVNGGRITIKISSVRVNDGDHGKPNTLASGQYAEISVHDTGPGIDKATLSRMFEAFFTTKPGSKGTGLGLSIVETIMKENDGFVDVESKQGKGTIFFIYLPILEPDNDDYILGEEDAHLAGVAESEPAPVDIQSDNILTEADKEGATILLVEDDAMIRDLITQTLEAQNYKVVFAEEGWEGIKIARNHKGKIDLLFTDVIMPGLGGIELAVAARELYPEIKILFMSGYSRSQLKDESIPPDAALLEKPFTPDKVVEKVRKLLAR